MNATFNRAAYARYVALLRKQRLSGPESNELPAIVAELALTSGQLDADRKLVARVSELDRTLGGKSVAEQELQRRRHLREELKRRHQRELDEHSRSVDSAAAQVECCAAAAVELEGLKASRPELFDDAAHPPRLRV